MDPQIWVQMNSSCIFINETVNQREAGNAMWEKHLEMYE